ncbi:MAG: septum site-determining protein MinD [Eubacteriales bacterium]
MGKVIVIVSGKGGVGKTMFTANLGGTLSQNGKKVVLVDMDMGLRNLDICMGLENRVVYDIADVINGVCRIKQALIKDKRFPDLYLIAAPQNMEKVEMTPLHTKIIYEKLSETFDYVIVDGPAGIDEGMKNAISGADMAIIVTTPEFAALRDADKVDKILIENGLTNRKIVVNKLKAELISNGVMPSITEVSKILRADIIGYIQEDDNIQIATNNGTPIVLKTGTYIYDNFMKIIERIQF